MKTNTEEFRQFVVVCRIALQRGDVRQGAGGRANRISLFNIGTVDFGLTASRVQAAIGRAQNEIDEVYRLDRIRKAGRVNFPTRSDEIIAVWHHKIAA